MREMSDWSFEKNTDTFRIKSSLRQKEIMLNINISSSGLEQLLFIKASEHHYNYQEQLRFGKTSYSQ
jgi:predicted DNA binding CopG/RHH family protein